jgi:hypothetical protein
MKLKDDLMLMESYEQVLEEAKKKANPWAICNSSTGGKKKNPEKFEKCVKGVKKKTGFKKITENEDVASFSVDSLKNQTYAKQGQKIDNEQQSDEDLSVWLKDRIGKKLPADNDIKDDLIKLIRKLDAHKLGKEISNPAM